MTYIKYIQINLINIGIYIKEDNEAISVGIIYKKTMLSFVLLTILDFTSKWIDWEQIFKRSENDLHSPSVVSVLTTEILTMIDFTSTSKVYNLGESKVLQYFGNVKYSLATPDDLAAIMKVMNHIGLCNAELAWYSPIATHQIFCYGLEHGFGILGFRSTWPCLVVEVLVIRVKFLEPSGYCTVINCTFTFGPTNIFDYISGIMTQFKLMKHKFPK